MLGDHPSGVGRFSRFKVKQVVDVLVVRNAAGSAHAALLSGRGQ
jgi:hypothetical protein